jgi:uncharacterized membrane protein (UPF0127 family)
MRYVSVVNMTTGETLAERAMVAETPLARFIGLQGKRQLPKKSGLVLMPNNSIHTFFMRIRIDAVFVSQDGKVVKVRRQLRPWHIGPVAPGALYCVELPAGAAAATMTGQIIALRACS